MNLPGRRNQNTPSTFGEWFERPLSNALDFFRAPLGQIGERSVPSIDITETDKEYQIRAEIPGMSREDLNVTYSQGTLTIEGEKKEEKKEKQGSYTESRFSSFRRDIPLEENLLWDKSKAVCRNGVLSITIPKAEEEQKGSKINVQ